MLTEKDIQDLKDYVDDYEDFCKAKNCEPDCEVLVKKNELIAAGQKASCWSVYCQIRNSQKEESQRSETQTSDSQT